MPDDAKSNRTFRILKIPYADFQARTDAFLKAGARGAFLISGKNLTPAVILPEKDQDFTRFATAWERAFSKLVSLANVADPIVTQQGEVVAYFGWFGGSSIFVPYKYSQVNMQELIDQGVPIVVAKHNTMPSSWDGYEFTEQKFCLIVAVDGVVIERLEARDVGFITSDTIQVYDLYAIGSLLIDIGEMAGRVLVNGLQRRLGSRSVSVGISKELAAAATARRIAPAIDDLAAKGIGKGQQVLVVGAETQEEFEYALRVNRNGSKATVVNPRRTAAADAFLANGGDFIQIEIEKLPKTQMYDLIREDFPYPTGSYFPGAMVDARLSRLKPGGTWVVITEKEDFVKALEATVQLKKDRVLLKEVPVRHEGLPVSTHPRDMTRYILVVTKS